ncbi:UBP-type zinc finger domain-containing protein [Streptomyces sanyensis]|uniref:UBP-type zinc finger domain-containing protein n=1 Tax=Streptomyces sanyensis TaxID=568869 RepID=UPI003D777F09
MARGWRWVHLRACLTCGHIGCCDSSRGQHAWAHAREAGHPVAASFEKGEHWAWCYVDEVFLLPRT